MLLLVQIEELDARTAVVPLEGPLTLGTNLKIAESQLQGLLAKGVLRLVLDLTGVPYCDSSGLGVLVHSWGLAKQQGGMLRLCGLSEKVTAIVRLTTTDSFLPVDADRAGSLAALG